MIRIIPAFTIIFISCLFSAFGQSDSLRSALGQLDNNKPTTDTIINTMMKGSLGNMTVVADSSIINLEKSTRRFKETKGYRIQIFIGSTEQSNAERNKYLSLGLTYSAYRKSIVPEMAIQIGDFTTRMEMERNLEIIKKYYPKAFGVVDVIEPPKFNGNKK